MQIWNLRLQRTVNLKARRLWVQADCRPRSGGARDTWNESVLYVSPSGDNSGEQLGHRAVMCPRNHDGCSKSVTDQPGAHLGPAAQRPQSLPSGLLELARIDFLHPLAARGNPDPSMVLRKVPGKTSLESAALAQSFLFLMSQ
ncbi:Hemicentin-2 [Manis pentadactyla]|nr:Hemicentin-2 [Manis pentadactyla]